VFVGGLAVKGFYLFKVLRDVFGYGHRQCLMRVFNGLCLTPFLTVEAVRLFTRQRVVGDLTWASR